MIIDAILKYINEKGFIAVYHTERAEYGKYIRIDSVNNTYSIFLYFEKDGSLSGDTIIELSDPLFFEKLDRALNEFNNR